MSFFSELKRRHVFKVAAAYAVVGWLLVQILVTVEAPLVALAANSSGDLELDTNEFRVLFDSLWDDR